MKAKLFIAVCAVSIAVDASADVIAGSDSLPSTYGAYFAATNITFSGGTAVISNLVLSAFSASTPPPSILGSNVFSSYVAQVDLFGTAGQPRFALGTNVEQITFTNVVGSLRVFNTELLSMDIAGGNLPVGVLIRESPTLASIGQTTITNLGGGQFLISSFFDIFTELSFNGGSSWTPNDGGPMHITLEQIPEPPAIALFGLGLAGLWVRISRRSRDRKFKP